MPVSGRSSRRSLDVRSIPTWERHARIFAEFQALDLDASLLLLTDHEPRPLRLEFERRYPWEYVWSQRHLGVARWEVALRRVDASGDAEPQSIAAFFRRTAVLADARGETRAAMAQAAIVRSIASGAPIVEQDAQWPYLGFLMSGSLTAITGSASGREQHLFDILPFETFGAAETLDGGRTLARIAAIGSPATVVLVPRGVTMTAMSSDFAFALALAAVCAQRTRSMADAFTAHVTQSAIVRVASALLPYAAPDAGLSPTLEPLQRMTQAQLAATAGTAKEVAARALAELEAAGAIKRAKGRIALADRQRLQDIADEA